MSIHVEHNAGGLVAIWARDISMFDAVLTRGIRDAAILVDNQQVKNLSGSKSDPFGAYPVPVRTGTLRRGHFFEVPTRTMAIVSNTTEYAVDIHASRPFLTRAADEVDISGTIERRLAELQVLQ